MAHHLTGHQPARVVLVETGNSKFTAQVASLVCDALENVLCISANMAGPSRIPLLSIYLLSSYPEVILPLTCTKGNFVRLQAALSDIRNFFDEPHEHNHSVDLKPCIAEGVSEACAQFRRYINSSAQALCSQVEVIIITAHPGDFVQQLLRSLPDHFDLNSIKRIVSATVQSQIMDGSSLVCDPDPSTLEMDSEGFGGMVDCLSLDCDPASLQRFFYSWFTEKSSEAEHLQIVLPPPCPADPDLVIKCDVSERLICPHQLPSSDVFSLHTESSICKHIYPPPSKTLSMTLPVQRLEVVGVVSRQDVCESVLFGFPMVLSPTTCWKMEWDELETNQENFTSLCAELNEKDQVLLTQAAPPPNDTSHQRPVKAGAGTKARAYFLLMPSSHRSVLVKSVIPQELLLPSSPTLSADSAKPESILRIKASLSEVKCLPDLNPLTLTSGLIPALRHTCLPRSAVDKARAVKHVNATNGPAHLNKVSAGQQDIGSFFSSTHRPAQRPVQPMPGSRLTANHRSNPLFNVNKTRQTKNC